MLNYQGQVDWLNQQLRANDIMEPYRIRCTTSASIHSLPFASENSDNITPLEVLTTFKTSLSSKLLEIRLIRCRGGGRDRGKDRDRGRDRSPGTVTGSDRDRDRV